jgi:acetylserotonin N-methyltransferase
VAGVRRLLDVGGGSGSYSIAALLHHPQLSATVLDLPPVCEVAARYAGQYGVGARFATAAVDMFRDPWPTDHDRILMSDVLHDWDDERCALLLRRAHDALPPAGRVWVHEMILDDVQAGPAAAAAYSMIMVFVTQGRQRSAPELAALLSGAGFTDIQVTMTTGGFALLEGTRA